MTIENAIKLLNSIREIIMRNDSWLENTHEPINEAFDMAQKALKQTEWIPVSERLPENEGTYLVYAPDYRGGSSRAKENHNGVMFSRYKNGKWSIEHGYYERPNCVTAWMPLPEPYKEGEQDE